MSGMGMTFSVMPNKKPDIKLDPATPIEEILQNVQMIVSTMKTTVPLYRDFGISPTFIDMPMAVAEAILIGEIYDAMEAYEPRAEIKSITFERNESIGKLVPVLEVGIDGGQT